MPAGTTSYSPSGVGASNNTLFNSIGKYLIDSRNRAAKARTDADNRLSELDELDDDDKTQEDLIEEESLQQKRNQSGYFMLKALRFGATDPVRKSMGRFQRNPSEKNDPAASPEQRFYAKPGMFSPGEMPKIDPQTGQPAARVGEAGVILGAISDLKAKLSQVAAVTAKSARTTAMGASAALAVTQSVKKTNLSSIDIARISGKEVEVVKREKAEIQKLEDRREKEEVEARAEAQLDVAGTVGYDPTGIDPFDPLKAVKDVIDFFRGKKDKCECPVGGGGRPGGSPGDRRRRQPGGGFDWMKDYVQEKLDTMRGYKGRRSGRTQYSSPIGPLPRDSQEPWARRRPGDRGGMYGNNGYTPRLESNPSNPINTPRQRPRFRMPGRRFRFAEGGGLLTRPTNVSSVFIRPDRTTGTDHLSDPNAVKTYRKVMVDLPQVASAAAAFAPLGVLSSRVPFFGGILSTVKDQFSPFISSLGVDPNKIFRSISVKGGGGGAGTTSTAQQESRESASITTTTNSSGGGGTPNVPAKPEQSYSVSGGKSFTTAMFGNRGFGTKDGLGSGSTEFGHTGRDVSLPTGTPLSIIPPGTVIESSNGYNGGYGNFVAIKLDDGRYVKSNHHSVNLVKEGDRVGMQPDGTVKAFAKVGSTGLSTGPHLHLDLGSGYNRASGSITGLENPDNFILNAMRQGGEMQVDGKGPTPPTILEQRLTAALSSPTPQNKPIPGLNSPISPIFLPMQSQQQKTKEAVQDFSELFSITPQNGFYDLNRATAWSQL